MPTRYDGLHPLTKLTLAFVLIVTAYMSSGLWLSTIAFIGALLTTATSEQRIRIAKVYPLFFVPIILSLLLIRGVFLPDVHTHPIFIAGYAISIDALAGAGLIILRYCTLVAALFTVLQTTPTAQLTQALAERGMPRSIEYILLMALQIIPDMQARAAAILEAQQSRGLVIKSIVSRVQALLPLIGPLVVGALVDIEERAMALELRAFAATSLPTRMAVIVDSRAQQIARTALLLCAVLIIGLRIAGRLPS